MQSQDKTLDYALLGLLALLWGASYIFTKVAVAEIPPVTLIALRVAGAALFLGLVLWIRGEHLPRGWRLWGKLGLQAFFNSIGAWTVLAWGQQHVEAGLASVLNSTSPIFVFLFTREALGGRKLAGALLGLGGVVLIVGVEALAGLGESVAGQLACLVGAMLYAGAALYGRNFARVGALQTALGTMIWATLVLVPLAFVVEAPLSLGPSPMALAATLILAVSCTGLALLVYFRLVRTLGPLGVASQSYLRAGIGVLLGVAVLGERLSLPVVLGLCAAIAGVWMMNGGTRRAAVSAPGAG
ncbi:DMT family transporter [Pararhodobacter aggregans]